MKITRQSWTNSEIEKLSNFVTLYKTMKKEMNWEDIGKQLNRTASQCKSYYQNILKEQLNYNDRKNHTWTRNEIMSLWIVLKNYDNDFKLAQANFFPNLSIKQLQSQWIQVQRRYAQHVENFRRVQQDNSYIKLIPKKQFIAECYIIKVSIRRMDLVEKKIIQMSTEQLQDNGYVPDIMEIKGFNSLWGDMDPLDIELIYKIEQISRGITEDQVDLIKQL
ncbi:Myb-like_DNA-binding domain-containing protein [Hexamita inflata]|uniref:Myb-like DNA-binding domain-containing protein n=1 Tax=Hexamita inflata TaxID=28002 RepID=A0AA86QXY4_9EUKA|nr:Myb-like DNA-binding domain-containing protein [Hexamita inflata]CAI9968101.1 Myb-like DNA-binding domain-containing protein [Hexamita inflata]